MPRGLFSTEPAGGRIPAGSGDDSPRPLPSGALVGSGAAASHLCARRPR
jgi:hypothetical protein